ncbi:arginine N-succinyltransferase [Sneathiella glossodoripedis]|uniref:arginine N-succinyltransferase n=1 Tax=Sneathiella glossodoripedis TaxID=418853 RepID=UPI00046EAC0A|nr:arginine N-succinyltransferase [Sneathiella glossodoripedis]
MIFIRPAQTDDLDSLLNISLVTGSGMSSMPSDLQSWKSKISTSIASFAKNVTGPEGEIYFMVMEDSASGEVVGTTAIYAGVGLDQPFYSYKVSKLVSFSKELNKKNELQVLHLVNDFTGATEIGSLYLHPDYRKDGNGRFLSRSRFLMLADFPSRFGEPIIAELRGWQDDTGRSPFWEHLGQKFFGLGFENADFMSSVKGKQFIADLMPRHPIYADILPDEAQTVIGKAHNASAPALRLLEKEGFRQSGYVDIFDGGPTVQCQSHNISTTRNAQSATVKSIVAGEQISPSQPRCILSNRNIQHYRLVCDHLIIHDDETVSISEIAAKILKLSSGDLISYVE